MNIFSIAFVAGFGHKYPNQPDSVFLYYCQDPSQRYYNELDPFLVIVEC